MKLDLVDDLDCDSDGIEPSDKAFDAVNTINEPLELIVPPGIYRFGETHTFDRREDLRLIAERGNARFRPPDGTDREWLRFECDTHIANIDIDRHADETSPTITIAARRRALIENMIVEGVDDVPDRDLPVFDVRMDNPRSDVVFRNLRFPARSGSVTSKSVVGRAGIGAGSLNYGTITLEDCIVEECSGPGVDVGQSVGELRVKGGRYANNADTQINLSQPSSRVDGATVVVDPASAVSASVSDYDRLSGIDVGAPPTSDDASGEIVDSDVRVASGDASIVDAGIYGTKNAQHSEIRGTDVRVDPANVPAIQFDAPERETPDPEIDYSVDIFDVVCAGTSRSGDAVVIDRRPKSEIRETCIETPGERQPYRFTPKAAVKSNLSQVQTTESCDFFRGPLQQNDS